MGNGSHMLHENIFSFSVLQAAEDLSGWDRAAKEKQNFRIEADACDKQKKGHSSHQKYLASRNEDGISLVGQQKTQNHEAQEATSPMKPKAGGKSNTEKPNKGSSPKGNMQPREKVSWKKIAREKGKAQAKDTEMLPLNIAFDTKCPGMFDALEKEENRIKKRSCVASNPPNTTPPSISAVAAKQHC